MSKVPNRVIVRPYYSTDSYGIWFYAEENRKGYIAKAIDFEFEEFEQKMYLPPKPTLFIPNYVAFALFDSFLDQMESVSRKQRKDNKKLEEHQAKHIEYLQSLADRILEKLK